MALEQWAIPELGQLLPLDEGELHALLTYTNSLPDQEATQHLEELLGNSPNALRFIATYIERRRDLAAGLAKQGAEYGSGNSAAQPYSGQSGSSPESPNVRKMDPAAPNMGQRQQNGGGSQDHPLPLYAPPSGPPPASSRPVSTRQYIHTNPVIEAGKERARDEQEMQQMLQQLQFQYRIYNSDIEPEHDTDFYCNCPIHQYQYRKQARYPVQERWSAAVMYPGEKHYNDNKFSSVLFSNNPYRYGVVSPYGYMQRGGFWGPPRPQPSSHARSIHQTIQLNNQGNRKAQADVDAKEPKHSIWENDTLDAAMSQMSISNSDKKHPGNNGYPDEKATIKKRYSQAPSTNESMDGRPSSSKPSKLSGFKSALGIKSTEEKAVAKVEKAFSRGQSLREQILAEENGRWPDEQWRQIVATYQDKVGMTKMIADLRARKPIQYLHLLRAGYFEPIPVAWANQMSNPLKFTIDAAAGWRGITPAWRGYEDTAEERLYWVLNHREGSVGMRMKPDFISEMNMARDRMAKAVEPPPLYFDAADTCHVQHTSDGYSKQVMPPPFRPYDQPEQSTDDTMVLLDVSGSMDFDPVRPVYNQYLITGYERSTQPKNKDVAKAIIRRFTDAMANHDRSNAGYEFTTFSNSGQHIGTINHRNFDSMWRKVRFGGGTRVMTGWQLVKELHFQKHSESATHHPVYGWQAGPETPILRLLLLLDGEATDMDEFELDLLSCSWAHVTIFLIGVDGCPHHHRHANELQRISDVNHHVSFVDAQGNCPERFVTHELLKRHLGYDITMREFEEMEAPPAYDG